MSAEALRRGRIVITGKPDDIDAAGEPGKFADIGLIDAQMRFIVMKGIAQEDEPPWPGSGKRKGKMLERGTRVIGRQMHATARQARGFFEMEIGDQQGFEIRYIERASEIGQEIDPAEFYARCPRQGAWPHR
jgi:hypothetical protein